MSESEHVWRAVARVDEVMAGVVLEVAVGNKRVILVRVDGEVVAYQGTCPHQFARLGRGTIADGWLHCPHHRAKFQLTDGTCGPGWDLPALQRHDLRINDGAVHLQDPLE
ncbi:MAG: hypothetical protein CMM47_08650 [Rhodospirillaceae bacterium]|nr:hypothetical protein [Rhodospirillaceae bacterium]